MRATTSSTSQHAPSSPVVASLIVSAGATAQGRAGAARRRTRGGRPSGRRGVRRCSAVIEAPSAARSRGSGATQRIPCGWVRVAKDAAFDRRRRCSSRRHAGRSVSGSTGALRRTGRPALIWRRSRHRAPVSARWGCAGNAASQRRVPPGTLDDPSGDGDLMRVVHELSVGPAVGATRMGDRHRRSDATAPRRVAGCSCRSCVAAAQLRAGPNDAVT
jgi:hypothetical protein